MVAGVGEGVAAAGRVRAMRMMMVMMLLVEFGAERLDDLVLLLQLLTQPAHTHGHV